jgi:hypothetical protein
VKSNKVNGIKPVGTKDEVAENRDAPPARIPTAARTILRDDLTAEELCEVACVASAILSLAVVATREGASVPLCGDAARAVEFANEVLIACLIDAQLERVR